MTSPKRLTDPDSTSSEALRGLLRAARADLPNEQRLRSMAAGIGPILGLGAAPVVSSGAAVSVGLKVGAVVLAVVAAAGGIALRSESTTKSIAMPSSSVARVMVAPAPTAIRVQSDVPGAVSLPRPLQASPPFPDSPIAQPSAASPGATQTPRVAVARPRAVSAPAADVVERRGVELPLAPPTSSAETVPLVGREDGRPTAAPPSPTTEVTLLRDAQDALRTAPAAALFLANEHAARFPAGVLGQEREVIAIEALIKVGRREEARARAGRFLAAVPRTAYRPRVEALLGEQIDFASHKP